jgi:hypothetical protein
VTPAVKVIGCPGADGSVRELTVVSVVTPPLIVPRTLSIKLVYELVHDWPSPL